MYTSETSYFLTIKMFKSPIQNLPFENSSVIQRIYIYLILIIEHLFGNIFETVDTQRYCNTKKKLNSLE